MQRITHGDLVYYQFENLWAYSNITHGLFTRLGGVSRAPFGTLNVGSTVGDDQDCVRTNRERMAAAMGFLDSDTRTVWQVHGTHIIVAREGEALTWPPTQADGIITADRDVPLVMRFADCVPLFFYDPIRQVIGLAHAGWRGTLAGIGPVTVAAMHAAFGCHPEDILAGIGPSIGPCCYEVGQEVVEQVEDTFGTSSDLIVVPPDSDGHHLDLWSANEHALCAAGVGRIEISRLCTACNTHEFYSHRAEQGRTGRFGAVLMMDGK